MITLSEFSPLRGLNQFIKALNTIGIFKNHLIKTATNINISLIKIMIMEVRHQVIYQWICNILKNPISMAGETMNMATTKTKQLMR